jgi:dipeptidyl aminopeptidase/acylaminoacyl peptidase
MSTEPSVIPVPLRAGNFLQWSPDGQWLAVVASSIQGEDQSGGIYLLTPDGSNLQLVVTKTEDLRPYPPLWSPDGSQLLFLADGDGTLKIFLNILTIATGEIHTYRAGEGVLKSLSVIREALWSSDGTKIVLAAGNQSPYTQHLYLVDRELTSIHRLTHGNSLDSIVQWHPLPQ